MTQCWLGRCQRGWGDTPQGTSGMGAARLQRGVEHPRSSHLAAQAGAGANQPHPARAGSQVAQVQCSQPGRGAQGVGDRGPAWWPWRDLSPETSPGLAPVFKVAVLGGAPCPQTLP